MTKSLSPSTPGTPTRARARKTANGSSEMRVKCPLADKSPQRACSQRGFKTIYHLNEHLKSIHVNPASSEVAAISAATMEKVHEVTSRHRRAGINIKWQQIKAVVDQADTNSANGCTSANSSVGPYIPTPAQLKTTISLIARTRVDNMFVKSGVGEVSTTVDKLASSIPRYSQLSEVQRAIRIQEACELFPCLIDAVGLTGVALAETEECDPRGLLPGEQPEVSDQHDHEQPSESIKMNQLSFEDLLPVDLSLEYGVGLNSYVPFIFS